MVFRVFKSPICPICFWSKPGFAENELIWLSILCTIVHLLNKHSSIDRFRTIRESTSFPFSPCSSTRTIAGEKPGDGRTLHLTWVANLAWIAIPWSLTGYLKCPLSAFSTLSTGWWMKAIPKSVHTIQDVVQGCESILWNSVYCCRLWRPVPLQ